MPRCGFCDNECSPTAKMCPKCGDDLGEGERKRPWDNIPPESGIDRVAHKLIIAGIIVFFFIVLFNGGGGGRY